MARLRAEDGYLGYLGIMAALVIVAVLTVTQWSKLGFGVGGSGSDGLSDPAAQSYAQAAYSALQRCSQTHGGPQTCGSRDLVELDPNLLNVKGGVEVDSGTVSVRAGDVTYSIGSSSGGLVRSCDPPGQGACPPTGRW